MTFDPRLFGALHRQHGCHDQLGPAVCEATRAGNPCSRALVCRNGGYGTRFEPAQRLGSYSEAGQGCGFSNPRWMPHLEADRHHAVKVLDLPRYRTIGQLHDGKPRTFCVPNCMHAAHHVNQSFESFRFKETRCDRTAVSARAYDCHRRISGKSGDASKKLRQRNMDWRR